MTVTGVSQSSQAFQAYERVASQRDVSSHAQQATENAAASGTETARLRERSYSFSLGKFGVAFTAQDVELDTDSLAAQTQAPTRESFSADLEAASILDSLNDQPTAATLMTDNAAQSGSTAPAPDTSRLTRARAMQAYAEASLNFEAAPGRTVGNV